MSDTPRTDEIQNEWAGSGLTWEVMFEFCRKLERIVRRCHEALGEDAESDDETLPNSIALHVREGRERIAELERELAQRPEERTSEDVERIISGIIDNGRFGKEADELRALMNVGGASDGK